MPKMPHRKKTTPLKTEINLLKNIVLKTDVLNVLSIALSAKASPLRILRNEHKLQMEDAF